PQPADGGREPRRPLPATRPVGAMVTRGHVDTPGSPRDAAFAGPYADIHCHGESNAWLDGLLAKRDGRPPYDWESWRRALDRLPSGPGRIATLVGPMENDTRDALLDEPEWSRLVLATCLGHG